MDDYSDLFEEVTAQEDANADLFGDPKAGINVQSSINVEPEKAAKHTALGKRFGVPPAVVDTFSADYEARAKTEDAMTVVDASPKLGKWLGNENNAKIAHKDIAVLGETERTLREWATDPIASLASGGNSLMSMGAYLTHLTTIPGDIAGSKFIEITNKVAPGTFAEEESLTPAQKMYSEFQESLSGQRQQIESFKSPKMQASNKAVQAAEGFGGTIEALYENPLSMVDFATQQLVQLGITGKAMQAAGAGLKGAELLSRMGAINVGITATMGGSDAGTQAENSVRNMSEEDLYNGSGQYKEIINSGYTPEAAREILAQQAGVVSGLIAAPISGFIGKLGAGIESKFVGQLMGEQAASISLSGALKQFIPIIAKESLEEFSDEAMTQVSSNAGVKVTADENVDLGKGALEAGAIGVVLGANFATAPAISNIVMGSVSDRMKVKQSEIQGEQIDKINELAKVAKIAEHSNEEYAELIKEQAADGSATDMYISGNVLFQSGVADRAMELSQSVREQLPAASQIGGLIRIPMEEYMSKLANSDIVGSLTEHLKTNPDSFSRAEAADYLATEGQKLADDIQRALDEQMLTAEFKQSQSVVNDDVASQLTATGRFIPAVVNSYSQLTSSWYATRAAKLGVTPEELYKSNKITITDSGSSGQVLEQRSLADWDALLHEIDYSENKPTQSKDDANEFLSNAPTGTRFTEESPLLKRIRKSSDQAFDELGGSPEAGRVGKTSLGQFSSYRTQADIIEPDSIHPDGRIEIHVYGKEQDQKGGAFATEPALTFTVSKDGELSVNGPTGETFNAFKEAGWAQDATGKDGEVQDGWTALTSKDGKPVPISQLSPLIADVHARVRAWRGEDKIGLHWSRSTGATGAILGGRQTSVFFQNKINTGTFDPSTNTISLLKDANLSTFLHEMGHFFFENDIKFASQLINNPSLTEGEQEIINDVSALLKWHGIEGDANAKLNTWYSMSFEEQRGMHERTAESFEHYLFSGKAPTMELYNAFQNFARWMVSTYRSIKQFLLLNPEAGSLTPEVRSVFDRMLATSDQIQAAEQARAMIPMISTIEDANKLGLTSEEFSELHFARVDATNQAIDELQTKSLKDMQWLQNSRIKELKKLQKEHDSLRQEVLFTVRSEVMAQPVYQAWAFLARKLTADDKISRPKKEVIKGVDESQDSLFKAIAKLGGINKESLVSEFGLDAKDKFDTQVFGKPVSRAKDGMSVSQAAEALADHGYLSKDEHGKYDISELESKFMLEHKGEKQYSVNADYDLVYGAEIKAGDEIVNPSALNAGRLDLDSIAEYSPEIIKLMQARRMTAKEGLHPDLVASLTGFDSGDALVQSLNNAEDPKVVIDRLTDERMLQQHGELATPADIEREADRAVHNKLRAKVLTKEHNALAKATGGKRILLSAAKEFADRLLGNIKIRDIRPNQFVSAEVKSAKAAETAFKKGDLKTASIEKRNQVIQNQTASAAYDANEEVKKAVVHLKKIQKSGPQSNMRGESLAQINAILERFDLRVGLSDKQRQKENNAGRVPLAAWVDSEADRLSAAVPDLPAFILNESYRKHYRDITLSEFRDLADSVKQLEHLARRENKQYKAIRNKTFGDERTSVLDELRINFPKAFDKQGVPKQMEKEYVNKFSDKIGKAGDYFNGQMLSPENIIKLLSAGKFGALQESLFSRMSHASDDRAGRLAGLYHEMKVQFKAYSIPERLAFSSKGIFVPEVSKSFTRENIVMIALYNGNIEGRERLKNFGWNDSQISAIVNKLDEKDVNLIEKIWDTFDNTLWPELKALNERTIGKSPPKVQAVPFMINDKEVKGGYMRLKYDNDLDERAQDYSNLAATKALLGNTLGMSAKTNQSTSKARVEGVTMRPRLDLGVFAEAVTETVHDLAFREAVADSIRMLKDRKVMNAIKQSVGIPAYRSIVNSVKDAASPPSIPTGPIERALNVARKNTVINLMSGVKTALQNFTGIFPAMAKISPLLISQEIIQYGAHPIKRTEFTLKSSPYMRRRLESFDRDLNEISKNLTVKGSILPSDSFYLGLMSQVDRMVTIPVWNAAFRDGMNNFGNETSKAVDYADHIIRSTQGSGREVDLAAIQSGHGSVGAFKKTFTMFYSYFSGQLGLLVTEGAIAMREAKENPWLAAAKYTAKFMTIVAIPIFLTELLMRGLPDEDDDEDRWVKAFASYGFAMVPFFRDIAAYGMAKYAPSAKYNSNFKMSPIQSSVETAINAPGSIYELWTGDASAYDEKQAIMGVSVLLGLPGKLISDFTLGTKAYLNGEAGPLAVVLGPPPK